MTGFQNLLNRPHSGGGSSSDLRKALSRSQKKIAFSSGRPGTSMKEGDIEFSMVPGQGPTLFAHIGGKIAQWVGRFDRQIVGVRTHRSLLQFGYGPTVSHSQGGAVVPVDIRWINYNARSGRVSTLYPGRITAIGFSGDVSNGSNDATITVGVLIEAVSKAQLIINYNSLAGGIVYGVINLLNSSDQGGGPGTSIDSSSFVGTNTFAINNRISARVSIEDSQAGGTFAINDMQIQIELEYRTI